ncbi:MAG: CPBP family intramembrane metalloprotease [Pirellulales bacterium]|nr:CPBP family intramembrane metalloprotease [Pirellulales bacterium]
MFLFAQQPIPAGIYWIAAIEGALLLGTFYAWIYLCKRFLSGEPVLPAYRPRKFTPWTGWDLLTILLFYMLLLSTIQFGIFLAEEVGGRRMIERGGERPAAVRKRGETTTTAHPLAQLLKDKNPLALALALAVGVVIAPIVEEVFFRLLLIGWLESSERRWRRKLRNLLRFVPRGMLPIILSSLVFASLHYRTESPEIEETNLILSLSAAGIVNLLVLAFSLVWVHRHSGATPKDLGWDAERFREDVLAGVTAFFAIALPIFALQIDLTYYLLPKGYAPDPITLFFFAIVLGLLYYRTHRIVPSIVLHMLLNASSLAMVWASP